MIQVASQYLLTDSDGTLQHPAATRNPVFVNTFVATTTTLDARNSDIQVLILTGSLTTLVINNMGNGASMRLYLGQDATGSRTITNYKVNGANANIKWAGGSAPTLTTTASAYDELIFTWDANAAVCRAKVSQNYAA